MKAKYLSRAIAWMSGAEESEWFYCWSFDDGTLYWSERSNELFPGYWGA